MSTEQIIGLSLAFVVMLIGLAGSVLPIIPGAPLMLAAAIGHRLWFGDKSVGFTVLIALIILTLITIVLDYVATVLGAKKFGATWRGGLGAVLGGLIGLFFGLPGIVLGPFLGAVLLEMTGGYELEKAARAGLGAMVGLLAGVFGKLAICVLMLGMFTASVVLRSWNG